MRFFALEFFSKCQICKPALRRSRGMRLKERIFKWNLASHVKERLFYWKWICIFQRWKTTRSGLFFPKALPVGQLWKLRCQMINRDLTFLMTPQVDTLQFFDKVKKQNTWKKLSSVKRSQIHSVFYYKNDFYKKQGSNFSNLINRIKKHSTKRLRLSWFGLFL